MFCDSKNEMEPFVIRAVQPNSPEKPCRNNGGKFLKEKSLKTMEHMKLVFKLLRTSVLP